MILSRDDAGKTFDVTSGEIIVLSLPEIPTSGYRWEVSAGDGLGLLSSSYDRGPGSGIGGGGTRTFRFRAISPGMSHIEAKLWRQWLGEASTIDRCQLAIRVVSV